ncbi:hypothetical protein M434DRAFT_400483 [Hypoxylon sp. CO27-5]|nr:hypothetical protein M434DRAFT_400483 [Hypoxylon sp. CO27-5]
MCNFSGTRFPCGCITFKGSEYKYCAKRGKGCSVKIFREYEWQTFCPESRRALKGKNYDGSVILPKCCSRVDRSKLEALCIKCNSIPDRDIEHRCWCSQHLVCLSVRVEANAEKEFEKFVLLWPSNLRTRYFRRKKDRAARDCGWSL